MRLNVWSMTECGDVRQRNEDSILAVIQEDDRCDAGIFVVADGMGGLQFGDRVSNYITERFGIWWNRDFMQLRNGEADTEENVAELLDQEIWDINTALYRFKEENKCRAGSTLSLLLISRNRYLIRNMGDSRVYLFRRGSLQQLTEDQSLVAELVRGGEMTSQEARMSAKKNILTMCMGMFMKPQYIQHSGNVAHGDVFLLCSDGMHNQVDLYQMQKILGDYTLCGDEKLKKLRAAILPGTAADNISIIVVEAMD